MSLSSIKVKKKNFLTSNSLTSLPLSLSLSLDFGWLWIGSWAVDWWVVDGFVVGGDGFVVLGLW